VRDEYARLFDARGLGASRRPNLPLQGAYFGGGTGLPALLSQETVR